MKINIRGRRAYLYRRRWVPVGPGVPHAHPTEDYLGAIDADAESIPDELLTLLTDAERSQIHQKVIYPAATARAAVAQRESDPGWRIAEATRLLSEAAQCSQTSRVPLTNVTLTRQTLDKILVTECLSEKATSTSDLPSSNPLADALAAIKAATTAVRDGTYGQAPSEGARSTEPYRLWSEIYRWVEGDDYSLLRALQEKGYVKWRKV